MNRKHPLVDACFSRGCPANRPADLAFTFKGRGKGNDAGFSLPFNSMAPALSNGECPGLLVPHLARVVLCSLRMQGGACECDSSPR